MAGLKRDHGVKCATFEGSRARRRTVSYHRDAQLCRRRVDGREVNAIVRVSITGGIWWHFTDWLGAGAGNRLEAIHMIGGYCASTDDSSGSRAFEKFLLTGRTQA